MKQLFRFILVSIIAAPACWCGTIGFSQQNIQTLVGNSFSLDVVASDVFDLYAFQFDLTWDPAVLGLESVGEGEFLPLSGSTFFDGGDLDNTAGLTFVFDTLFGEIPGASGTGTLAHLSFETLNAGTSALGISDLIALDSSLNDAGITAADASVNVSAPAAATPEPAAWLLMVIGLFGVWWSAKPLRTAASLRSESGAMFRRRPPESAFLP